jgi:hypothetical protein
MAATTGVVEDVIHTDSGPTLSPTTPSYRPTPAEEVLKSNEVESYGYGMLRNYEEFPRECSRKISRH